MPRNVRGNFVRFQYYPRMKFLLATVSAVFLVTFLDQPNAGAGWFWDTGNAMGFAAFAGMLCLSITGNRRFELRAHRLLGYSVLFVAMAHSFWFLLGDAAVVDFLKPGAPDYMWFGLASLIFLGISVCAALLPDRLKVYKNYSAFKYWHLILAIVTVSSALYHIIVSDFYLSRRLQGILLIVFSIALLSGRSRLRQFVHPTNATTIVYLGATILLGTIFVTVRNVSS
jgi:hypothetical protein